ncbi:peptidase M22 [Zongyangia hominis]|uniref:N(6)-L-threonylcarbamoyladenine synthase n=1 Tax=Zongyangia hominis TaxID=2763677 RepID=A0A926E832_9FIRM|nr:peptidase M22 [Zongyangia hominis]MBC8569600.1 peptidase M22 [Zongyangia hominis]
MSCFLGIDTSNYTTSAALYRAETGEVLSEKKLLPVREGEVGLRQSDAVFHHVKQLPDIIARLFARECEKIGAVGVSARPRDVEGSYMPCFLVGELSATSVASALHVPLYSFSHQAGHIMAAVFSSGQKTLIERPFLAFHISGGTTECLLIRPDPERIFDITLMATSLDLKAGQAVDRVGHLLGLSFPAGPQLEELALRWREPVRVRSTMKGADCCLSGVENQCRQLLSKGAPPEQVARYCIEAVGTAVMGMADAVLSQVGQLPILCAGGVMSNSIIRDAMQKRYGAFFAAPAFSSDNACGTAILTSMKAVKP